MYCNIYHVTVQKETNIMIAAIYGNTTVSYSVDVHCYLPILTCQFTAVYCCSQQVRVCVCIYTHVQ